MLFAIIVKRSYNLFMKIQINDRISYAVSNREYTEEGFLRVPGRVARVGIQDYLAGELGLTGDPRRIVKVMRPADEVFHVDSLASYMSSDVTIEHPAIMVNSETFKSVSVGTAVGPGVRDGDFVTCDLIIKDKEAIEAIESGKVQLSAGYTALYDDNVPEGADYEFIQRDIVINHVALVDRARAGAHARLFDTKPENLIMPKITLDSGRSVEVADEATATLVMDAFDRLTKQATNAKADVDKITALYDSLKESSDASAKLTSPKAMTARIKAIFKVKDAALLIAGKSFTCDSLDAVEIQRAALASIRPKKAWDDQSDVYVESAFDQAFEAAEEVENKDDDEKDTDDTDIDTDDDDDDDKKASKDSHIQLGKDASGKVISLGDARTKHNDSLTQAWKKNGGVA